MQRCFCCGEEVVGNHYMSPKCSKAITRMRQVPAAAREGSFSRFIDYYLTASTMGQDAAQAEIGADIVTNLEDISTDLGSIASTLEWGFEELICEMATANAVLQSIERKLDKQEATKANEQRLMAEEMRMRGVLDESKSLFHKSLELNPLDYRTYIGLAKTHLHGSDFDEAKVILLRGLPHAIAENNGGHVHRLIGRIFFAQGDTEKAVESLKEAIRVSPHDALAHYDCAHYCCLTGRTEDCLGSLKLAVTQDVALFNLAERETAFASVPGARSLLKGLEPDLRLFALIPAAEHGRFEQAREAFDAAETRVAILRNSRDKKRKGDLDLYQRVSEVVKDRIEGLRNGSWESWEISEGGPTTLYEYMRRDREAPAVRKGDLRAALDYVYNAMNVATEMANDAAGLETPQPQKVNVRERSVAPGAAHCTNCGAQLAPQANFCAQCGKKVANSK